MTSKADLSAACRGGCPNPLSVGSPEKCHTVAWDAEKFGSHEVIPGVVLTCQTIGDNNGSYRAVADEI